MDPLDNHNAELQAEVDSLSAQLSNKMEQLDRLSTARSSPGTPGTLSKAKQRAARILKEQNEKDIIGWGLQSSIRLAGGNNPHRAPGYEELFEEASKSFHGASPSPGMTQLLDETSDSFGHATRRNKLNAAMRTHSEPTIAAAHANQLEEQERKFRPPPRKKRPPPATMPMNQLRSMFSEKMKAIMMQDRALLRNIFAKFDTEKLGVLSTAQFHGLMSSIGIDVTLPECKNFMLGFTGGKAYMSFADFFQNLLGFPHDFFQMKLSTVNHDAQKPPERDLVRKLPETTSANQLAAMFVRSLRKELYDVGCSMRSVLRKEKNQNGLNSNDVYKLFHMQGITLNKVELQEIVDHFDFDMDGQMNCAELCHELLDLPLPGHIRNALPVPRRESRPKLGPRTRQLMELLRQQCRRAAVSHKKLDRLFTVYDTDGSGSIAYDEIQAMVKEFHLEVHGGDAAALILEKFAPSGAMSYEDFCTKVVGLPPGAHKSKDVDPAELRLRPQVLRDKISHAIKKKVYTDPSAIKRAFVMFDNDGGGEISKVEFQQGFKSMKLPATKKQVSELFGEYDARGTGYLGTKSFAMAALELEEEDFAPSPKAGRRSTSRMGSPNKGAGALSKMGIGSGLGTLSRPATGRSLASPIPQMAHLSSPARLSRPSTQMSRYSLSRGAPPRSATSMY